MVPHTIQDIKAIENVQRRFTKKLPGFQDITYRQRLEKLSLDTLEFRRLKFDLITAYKIIFGHLKIDKHNFFQFSDNDRTRGHEYKLKLPLPHTNTFKFSFSYRIVSVWNSITADYSSLSNFRKSLTYDQLKNFLIAFY